METVVVILDAEGEKGLTFRSLAGRLSTGAGAIYHHVADRGELMALATERVIGEALATCPDRTDADGAIRDTALAMFDAVDTHPWAGAELAREPWREVNLRILETIAGDLARLGVDDARLFDLTLVFANHILGAAAQNAANAQMEVAPAGREAFLADVASRWDHLDRETHPVMHRLAPRLPGHDDRQQFLLGIQLLLDGMRGSGTGQAQ